MANGSVLLGVSAAPAATVELCSLNSLMKTVRSEKTKAWIVLVRERSGDRVSDPQLNVFAARRCQGDKQAHHNLLLGTGSEQ